jgi:hypothetical protein
VADYAPSIAIDGEVIKDLIREGRRFAGAARRYLDEQEAPP